MRRHLWILFVLAVAPHALAKPPTLTMLSPSGARRGTTTLVTATGSFDHWPARGWAEAPGLTIEPAAEKGKFWVTVGERVPAGVYWVRVADEEGASAPRLFQVGTLPEVAEVEPNNDLATAQRIDVEAVTINGKFGRSNDVDGYVVRLAKGQTLVAAMEANRRLAAPVDGVLQVVGPDGFVAADVDDERERDPLLAFTAPVDGTYVVRTFAFPATPDSRIGFAGGDAYLYRLTLTTRGYVDHAFPLAVGQGSSSEVRAEGWNLGETPPTLDVAPGGARSANASHPALGGDAEVLVVGGATAVETGPTSLESPQEVQTPVVISGRIESDGDVDVYKFHAAKGVKLSIQIESRALGFTLDPTLRLLDAAGKIVNDVDDSGSGGRRESRDVRDAETTLTPSEEGDYRLVVRDLNRRGGLRYVYRLTIAPVAPSVRLSVAADKFTASPGKPASVKVDLDRREGFAEKVEIVAEGLPEGVTAKMVASEPKGDSAKSVTLSIEAAEKAASGPFRVVGRYAGGVVAAEAKVDGFSATIRDLWLASTPAAKEPEKSKEKEKK